MKPADAGSPTAGQAAATERRIEDVERAAAEGYQQEINSRGASTPAPGGSTAKLDGVTCDELSQDSYRCVFATTIVNPRGNVQVPVPYRLRFEGSCYDARFDGPDKTFDELTRFTGCISPDERSAGMATQEPSASAPLGSEASPTSPDRSSSSDTAIPPNDAPELEENAIAYIEDEFGLMVGTGQTLSDTSDVDPAWTVVSGFDDSGTWAVWYRDGEVVQANSAGTGEDDRPADAPCDLATFSESSC